MKRRMARVSSRTERKVPRPFGVAWVVVRKANLVTPITGDAELGAGALPWSMAAGR